MSLKQSVSEGLRGVGRVMDASWQAKGFRHVVLAEPLEASWWSTSSVPGEKERVEGGSKGEEEGEEKGREEGGRLSAAAESMESVLDPAVVLTSSDLVSAILRLPAVCHASLRFGSKRGKAQASLDACSSEGTAVGDASMGVSGRGSAKALDEGTLQRLRRAIRSLSPRAVSLCAGLSLSLPCWPVLHLLIESGALARTQAPSLVPDLVEHGRWESLDAALRCLPDLTAADVSLVLTSLLDPQAGAQGVVGNAVARKVRGDASLAVERHVKGGSKGRRGKTEAAGGKEMGKGGGDVGEGEVRGAQAHRLAGLSGRTLTAGNGVLTAGNGVLTAGNGVLTAGNGVERTAPGSRKALKGPEKAAIVRALGFTDAEICLHSLLLRPIDDETLSSALGDLAGVPVSALLSYLRKWLDRLLQHSDMAIKGQGYYSDSADANNTKAQHEAGGLGGSQIGSPRVPELKQVFGWLSQLLDAHLTKLLLMPATWEDLLAVQKAIQDSLGTVNSLKTLHGALSHLCLGMPLPQGPREVTGPSYTVEYIHLV